MQKFCQTMLLLSMCIAHPLAQIVRRRLLQLSDAAMLFGFQTNSFVSRVY